MDYGCVVLCILCMLESGSLAHIKNHQDNETTLQHGIAKVKPRTHIIGIYHISMTRLFACKPRRDVFIAVSFLPLVFEAHLGLRTLNDLNALPGVFRR